MIAAARFRSVLWVAAASTAGLACYLVTQGVASERAELARTERAILANRIAIRDLETELGARGSMAQMERWNTRVLALKAPEARQYLHGDVQLASLGMPETPAMAARVVQVAATKPVTPTAPAGPAAPEQVASAEPLLRHATYMKPPPDRVVDLERKVSARGDGLLGADAVADLDRIARSERGAGGQ
ncbi:hypothetical protein SAMN06295912_102185 [Sphingomonas laterariae]|uniref:Uncharacterized protein n=1 Tax=Edaphosphingomonas laterariae TaxID=861865 RepID=A0A239CFH7_9SPHN|nr:hypothetical protein [Sphingomonas laterariae]SNS18975.1 hypothetical protein SAMN06295912_102185 [Sphingomonas laterariae]